jgi:hypothetical protein
LKELFSMLMEVTVAEFAAELRMLSKLKHEHIVPFYGMFVVSPTDYPRYFLVTKYAVRQRQGERCSARSGRRRRARGVPAMHALSAYRPPEVLELRPALRVGPCLSAAFALGASRN